MPNTTNFNFPTPADTDLVKDGASAIRSLGNSIDTAFVDLKGGTTGQILSKASNTDLDYTWINNDQGDITGVTAGTGISGGGTSGTVTITNSMATAIDAKGDLIVGTGADTFDRLAVGTNGHTLVADSSTTTGLKWAAASSGGLTLLSTTAITATASLDLTSISGSYTNLYVIIEDAFENSGASQSLTFNNNTSAYSRSIIQAANANTVSVATGQGSAAFCGPFRYVAGSGAGSSTIFIPNYASTNMPKHFWAVSSSGNGATWAVGQWDNKSAITSVKITWGGTPTAQGNVYLYGEK